jgi:signal peptidase I
MNIFITREGTMYRRWINAILSLLLPGCAQFLSGRKKTATLWILTTFIIAGIAVVFSIHPNSTYAGQSLHGVDIASFIFYMILIIDACRRPIPKMRIKQWGTVAAIFSLITIIIPVGAALLIRQYLIQPFSIPTKGMHPTIMGITTDENGTQLPGDRIFVNKTAYWIHPPQRGDIVVFQTSQIDHPAVPKNTCYIKRIVGLPGETVSINPPNILINGVPLKQPDIFTSISESLNGHSGYTMAISGPTTPILTTPENSVTLGKFEYLVLGDNSQNSLDSRYFGPIKRFSILGKVVYRYFPAHRKGWIK